jgi:hypothetical protein
MGHLSSSDPLHGANRSHEEIDTSVSRKVRVATALGMMSAAIEASPFSNTATGRAVAGVLFATGISIDTVAAIDAYGPARYGEPEPGPTLLELISSMQPESLLDDNSHHPLAGN